MTSQQSNQQSNQQSAEKVVKDFCTAISTQNWNLNFIQFCEVLEIDPGEEGSLPRQYAYEKFVAMGKLTLALTNLGTDYIVALVEDYFSKKSHRSEA